MNPYEAMESDAEIAQQDVSQSPAAEEVFRIPRGHMHKHKIDMKQVDRNETIRI